MCSRVSPKTSKRFLGGKHMNHSAIRVISALQRDTRRGPKNGSSTVVWFVVFALFLLLPIGAWAQDNATITGYVTDTSGALVPNANITLTNNSTNQARETISNTAGVYRFANVGIGTYTLTITAQSFQKYTKTGIVVNVAPQWRPTPSLAVGSQTQTVTVEADALQVQTETSEVSTLISGEQVSQLATNGRNITSLAALGLGRLQQPAAVWRRQCADVGQRHQLQWNPHHPQRLHD